MYVYVYSFENYRNCRYRAILENRDKNLYPGHEMNFRKYLPSQGRNMDSKQGQETSPKQYSFKNIFKNSVIFL